MKLSKFIKKFQAALGKHGDLEIYYVDDYDTGPLKVHFAYVKEMSEENTDEDPSLPEGKAMFLN